MNLPVWVRRLLPYVVMFVVWELVRRAADLSGFVAWAWGLATFVAGVAVSIWWSGDSASRPRE